MLRTLAEFDFQAIPSLSQAQVLELARGEYIERHENVALIGAIALGLEHISISF